MLHLAAGRREAAASRFVSWPSCQYMTLESDLYGLGWLLGNVRAGRRHSAQVEWSSSREGWPNGRPGTVRPTERHVIWLSCRPGPLGTSVCWISMDRLTTRPLQHGWLDTNSNQTVRCHPSDRASSPTKTRHEGSLARVSLLTGQLK
jgi:hypothetical protein